MESKVEEWFDEAVNDLVINRRTSYRKFAKRKRVSVAAVHSALKEAGHTLGQEEARRIPLFLRAYSDPEERFESIIAARLTKRTWAQIAEHYPGQSGLQICAAMKRQCLRRGLEWPIREKDGDSGE